MEILIIPCSRLPLSGSSALQVLLSQRGKSEAAVLHFLKAFKHSVFALSMLEGCKPRLLKAVQELERANIFLGETWATYVG